MITEAFAALPVVVLGHGPCIVVFDDNPADMAKLARYAMEFCAIEIMRQMHAVPYRLDARGVEVMDKIIAAGDNRHMQQVVLLRDLCDVKMGGFLIGSLCRHGRHDAVPGFVGA